MPGTTSFFWPNSGTKKLWITSSARMLQDDLAVDRDAQVAALHPGVRVDEAPGELLRDDVHLDPVGLECLVVVEHDDREDGHDARAGSRARTVQTISSRVLPCIGGPSLSSPGGARNFQTA